MKVKMKLDVAGIKNWMLEHGEKLALGIVGVAVLLFTYSAVRCEVLDASQQPDNLRDLSKSVSDHVAASPWDPKRVGVQVVDYAERAKSKPVKVEAFALLTPFNPPVRDPKAKRGVPPVLGVEDLRVAAGYDVFAVKEGAAEGAANSKLQAQPWAVVTGLVPVVRQKLEYDRVFSGAVGAEPSRDVPDYYAPLLERAVVDEAHPEKVEWTRVSSIKPYEARWKSNGEEIVSRDYLHDQLTGNLGSLANERQKWGEAVSHPKVPLKDDESKRADAPAEPEAKPKEEGAKENDRPAFEVLNVDQKPPEPAGRDSQKVEPDVIEFRLLRAFDYSVEPGKKYRYRVTLGLKNPNHLCSPQYLKDPESARLQVLAGQPSQPTPVVTIPDGHRVLAGPVDGGSRYIEPTATLLVTAIDKKEGLEPATELTKVHRGSVANTEQTKVKVKDPIKNEITEVTLDFKSNILVLDIYGGRDLSRRKTPSITSPGEILLLDPDGNMMVRTDLDDRAQYESRIVRDEPPPPKKTKPLLENDKPKRGKALKSR